MRRSAGTCLEDVCGAVAELLGVATDAVPTAVPLRELGIDSAGLTRLAGELSVPAWAVWQYPTAAALAEYLSGGRVPAAPVAPARPVEPIAIVGLGCRLPGGIDSPAGLWDALLSEVDAVGPVPADRWGPEWYDADPAAPGRTTTRRGGFLDDVAGFDAAFFRISPAEADRMDPQQRIALEVAWSALEDARIVPGGLAGSRTGVFLGTMWQEYHLATGADPDSVGQHSAVGWDTSIVPARIAYALGLRGPAMAVGTACSSSLGAVHLAAHSLRRGESDLALAGGVHLMLHPHTTVAMTKFGGLNPDGQCRAFDAGANGYVRGEGCGVLVLRRLSDALRDGDRVYAVLRGSATNNDGASNGLTAPNPSAQVDVLRAAWREAGVSPREVSYVEAHGTGTALGDLVEASALGEVFGPGRAEPLRIGSAKTNFGHLEPAAGVLGVLKTVLALHHGELPASLHFDEPNPDIDFVGQRLEVVTARRPWLGDARFAGVSGFGFGGTNVHLALAAAAGRSRDLVALAAGSETDLRAMVAGSEIGRGGSGSESRGLVGGSETELRDIVAASETELGGSESEPRGLVAGLESEPRALVARAESEQRATELSVPAGKLETGGRRPSRVAGTGPYRAFAAGDEPLRVSLDGVRRPVAFCFSGHGGQWVGMGRDLLTEPAFRTALAEIDRVLAPVVGWSVTDELVAEQPRFDRTDVVQPTLFAIQVALARALAAWGVTPDAVFGQSVGEVAGAVTAGALDLAAGARLIGTWSRLVAERAAGTGTVLVREPTDLSFDRLAFAGELAPGLVCLSGPLDAIADAERELAEAGVRTLRVAIDYPSHSPGLAALAPELVSRLGDLAPVPTTVPMVSTVTGEPVPGTDLDAVYWARNMCRPMRVAEAARALPAGARVVEIGPHAVLRRPLERVLGRGVLATCLRDEPARRTLEDLLGRLWTDGVDVDWAAFGVTAPVADHVPWVLSGRTEPALRAQAAALRAYTDRPAAEVGHSLATTRSAFEHRAVLLGPDHDAQLVALAAGADAPGLVTGVTADAGPGPVLVFPGQGSQWTGMALDLLDSSPVFAARFAECARALAEYVDWSPVEELAGELSRVDVVQPVLWAVMVSLAELWAAHGVRPAAVVGHSQGEIAAAVVAGALSVEDGARVVALRSKAIARTLAGHGGMVSVALSRAETQRYLDGRLSLAAANGPGSSVVSGDPDALDELLARCRADRVRAKRIPVDYASHSAQVEAIRDELLDVLAPIRPRATDVVFVSTVAGEPVDPTTLDAGYWYRNLRTTVELAAAVGHLSAAGHRVFVEASPHPVLTMGIQETAPELVAVGSLRRDHGGLDRFLASVAEAHVRGVPVDWSAAIPAARTVDLPTYRFQHRRHWLETAPTRRTGPDEEFWSAVTSGDLDTLMSTLDVPADATLADLVSALAAWRARGEGVPEDWRYEVAWTPVAEARRATGTWLTLVPGGDGPASTVLAGLAAQGLRLVTVECAADQPRELLGKACAAVAAEHDLDGVLSLLALNPGPHPDHHAVPAGYAATLLAVQALGDAAITAPLWCVTSGAVVTGPGDTTVRPEQRMVWGLGRVAALEHGDRWGGLVDLPAAAGPGVWPRLAAALARDDGEDQLAVRTTGTLARRLVRATTRPATARWRPGGTVLVTGGTGALGTHIARWLARRGADRLVLTNRRGDPATDLVAELAGRGVEVTVEACDVADRDQLRALLDRVGPLDAVVHAAAVLDDAVLDALDLDQVATVLRVKAQGARNLHELTSGLSAFVLLSSLGATVGIPGQGNYAPANAYLDGLAELRRAEGLPATSVSFGAWAGAGMATTAVRGVLDRHGVPGMDPERAVLALQEAIDAGRAGQTVADVRWDRFAPTFTAVRPSPLLADFLETGLAAVEENLRDRLAAAPPARRPDLVRDLVLRHTAAVLGYRGGERPDPARAFRELGFDSVTGVDLRNRLGAETGLALPVTLVFEQPTPALLADHLLAELGLSDDAAAAAEPARLADVTDDELFDFIDRITTSRRAS